MKSRPNLQFANVGAKPAVACQLTVEAQAHVCDKLVGAPVEMPRRARQGHRRAALSRAGLEKL